MARRLDGEMRAEADSFPLPRYTTRVFPWRGALLAAGLMGAFVGWGMLELNLDDPWPWGARVLVALGIAAALLGGMLTLWDRYRRRRGLVKAGLASYRLLVIVVLIIAAFLFLVVQFPYPFAWAGPVGALTCIAGAGVFAVQALRAAPPPAFRAAQQAYAEGRDAEALELLAQIDAREERYEVDHLRAVIARNSGRYTLALEACERLCARHPDLYYGYSEKGLLLLAQGQAAEAIALLRRATEVAPYLAEGYYNLGMACVQAEAYREAVGAMSRALRLGLDDQATELVARFMLCQGLEALGEVAMAERERRRLYRQRGVLRRWRATLDEEDLPREVVDQQRALLRRIERYLAAAQRS